MKSIITWIAAIALLQFAPVQAQNIVPSGFAAGSITLADQSVQTGYIKEDFRKKATLVFISQEGKKTTYDGNQLNGVQMDSLQFVCCKGDFFKVICNGRLQLLEKWSDAASKPVYVGSEAQFINGSEGKPGEYYCYTPGNHELVWMNKKNSLENRSRLFKVCPQAFEQMNKANVDLEQVKAAVVLFNQCTP